MKETEFFPKFDIDRSPNIILTHLVPEEWAYQAEPLGLILLKGQIKDKREDAEVSIVDSQLEKKVEDIAEKIISAKPAILGLSLVPGGKGEAEQLLDRILPQLLSENRPMLLFGNVGGTFALEAILKEYPDSLVVIGEGEQAMGGILDFLYGERELENIPNIIYKRNGEIIHNSREITDLAKLTLPFREESRRYIEAGIQNVAESSRGCKYYCTFCNRHSFYSNTRIWRGFPIDYVIEDLEALSSIGSTGLTFADEDFFQGGLERVNEIAKRIIHAKQSGEITTDFQITMALRVDDVYSNKDTSQDNILKIEALSLLKQAGLVWVFMGVESGSQVQLKRFGKGISIEETRQAVKLLENLGLGMEAGFIMFDPLMSFRELRENTAFLKDTGLYKYIAYPFSLLRAEPGSAALTMVEKNDLIRGDLDTDWLKYSYDFKDDRIGDVVQICNNWREVTDPFIHILKRLYREKIFIGGARTSEAKRLFEYIGKTRLVFVNLLDAVADNIEFTQGQKSLETAMVYSYQEIGEVVANVLQDIDSGVIMDQDSELARTGREFLSQRL